MLEFPSFYLFNKGNRKIRTSNLEIFYCNNIAISLSKSTVVPRIRESENFISVYHANKAITDCLQNDNFKQPGQIDSSLFCWGFYMLIDKKNSSFNLINDPFGIYPIYYYREGNDFLISNNFDGIIKMTGPLTPDYDGIYDYFLFNYTLRSRTLIKEISRLKGYSRIEFESGQIKISISSISDLIFKTGKNCSESMEECLSRHLEMNIDIQKPVILPLTGGFDSKVILSLLLSSGKIFSTFTFGSKDSDDYKAANSIAKMYSLQHDSIEMQKEFLSSIESQLDDFLRFSPNAPMLDTLLFYELVKKRIPESNYISGIMGGELIVGPVLISELITTKASAFLTTSKSRSDLSVYLSELLSDLKIFNDVSTTVIDSYADSLSIYLNNSANKDFENVVFFLLNETYAKFFGSVFSNLFVKNNIINPFLDLNFLRKLYKSKYRFREPFSKAPLAHFRSRKLYTELIKKIEPSVLKSRMDRGYNLEDFMKWYKFYKPFLNYFKRHYLRKNRNSHAESKSADYLSILVEKALLKIPDSEILNWSIFKKSEILGFIDDVKQHGCSGLKRQKLLQLLLLACFYEKYKHEIQA